MSKQKDAAPLLPMQQPIEWETKTFNRFSMWYTDRPINARVQTYNRYLDWCTIWWDADITATPIWVDPFTTQVNLSKTNIYVPFEKNGSYPRDTSDWYLVIPTDWTYLVTWLTQFDNADLTIAWIFTQLYYDWYMWTWPLYQSWKYRLLSSDIISFTITQNFKRWDKITFKAWHAAELLTMKTIVYLTVAKIS